MIFMMHLFLIRLVKYILHEYDVCEEEEDVAEQK